MNFTDTFLHNPSVDKMFYAEVDINAQNSENVLVRLLDGSCISVWRFVIILCRFTYYKYRLYAERAAGYDNGRD